jgi:uncharacterized protein YbjT (DUF2867 family)
MGVILVVGATGQLGRAIVTKLRTAGTPVRALARSATRLAEMHPGVDGRAVDLLDVPRLTDACRGVDQIIATANNNMGTGANSPARVDLAASQNLCAAARTTGVRRLIYVSYRGIAQDAPVDRLRFAQVSQSCRHIRTVLVHQSRVVKRSPRLHPPPPGR